MNVLNVISNMNMIVQSAGVARNFQYFLQPINVYIACMIRDKVKYPNQKDFIEEAFEIS